MQSRRRVLLVTSTPDDQDFIDANTELDLISEIFRDGNNRKKFEIDIKHNIMKGSFQYKLDDFNPHIVHFSGHGTKKGKLVFQDGEEIDPVVLKNIFNNVKSIELIFLSACYSIKQVDELKKISNIKNIIGMNDKIAPYIANVFATHFYKNYTKRENVHIAFTNAMNNFKQIYKSILDPETLKPHDPDTLIQLIKTDKKHVDGNSSSSKEIEEDNTKYLQFDFVQKDPIPNDLFYQMQRCVSKYEEEVSIKKIDPVLFWNSDSSNISKIIPMLLTYSNEYGLDQNQVNIMKNNVEKIQVLVKLAVDNNDDNIVNVEDESSVNNNNNDDDNYIYSIIVDKTDTRKIISMIAIQKDAISLLKIPWIGILGNKFTKIEISKETAIKLKYELMPKDTNNFYPIRIEDGKVIGMIMFALQICGQH